MNSGARNAFAIGLGVTLGLAALAGLSGVFTSQIYGSPAALTTSEGSNYNFASPSYSGQSTNTINQGQSIGELSNPSGLTFMIILLGGISLVLALGVSLLMSRRLSDHETKQSI